jgi:ABC-type lipoprotein export system ATPase subunit
MGHHKIRRLSVTGGGFLDGVDVEFKDGLVCLIGPRGSGKTTVLELLRFAFDVPPQDDGGARSRNRSRFESLVSTNLGRGRVEVEFETQDGSTYWLQRSAGEDPLVLDEDGDPVDSDILTNRISIDVAMFSQNEIEDIAMQPGYLRVVLDRFCGKALTDIQDAIRQSRVLLQRNATDVAQALNRKQQCDAATKELPELDKRLTRLNEELDKAKLGEELEKASKLKALRTKESAAVARIEPAVTEARNELTPLRGEMFTQLKQVFSDDVVAGPNKRVFDTLKAELRAGAQRFQDGFKEMEAALEEMLAAAGDAKTALKRVHQPDEAHYQDMVKRSKESQAKLRERDKLAKQVAELKARKLEGDQVNKRLAAALQDRKRQLDEYSSFCEERFRVRESVARKLSGQLSDNIRISVYQDADQKVYKEFLVEYRPRVMVQYNNPLERVVQNLAPRALADLVSDGDDDELASLANMDLDHATGLIDVFARDPQALMELETLELDDVPRIELNLGGAQWKSSDQLSTGQMCSVVLPLLLLESVAPAVMDQPEDNLDNRYVTDNVVELILKSRDRRQMIFITHNPNIPVLGLADQVIVMESDGSRGWVAGHGNVDAMKTHIINLLEGGKEAFNTRKERYGC